MSKTLKKIISAATLFFYLVSGQGMSAFAGTPSAPVGMSMMPTASSFMGVSARQIARAPLSLPANLGLIEEFLPSASGSKLPAILHLQTAHSDYAAQMALVRVLNYLKKDQGFDLLLLEGADELLDPELDRFFKNDLWNEQVAKERVKTGRMSGAAYFLMRQSKGLVKAVGVESAEAYRNNRKDFLELIQKRETFEIYLKGAESDLDRLFAKKAAKPLLDLRRQERAFNQGRLDWASWIGELHKTALADLNLDLAHVSSQKDWPSLLRFLWLREMDTVTEKSEDSLADKGLSDSVKRILKSSERGGNFRYGEVRLILEKWLSRKNTKKTTQPSAELKATLKKMALQNEIRPQELWSETETLTQKLMDAYAKTPAEKELLRLDVDLKLLRGLVLTELSFQEYQRVLERGSELQPSRISQSLQRLSQDTAQLAVLEHENSERANIANSQMNHMFQTALHFYGGAKAREKSMAENALKLASQSRARYVVLVSGGFHAAGLRDELARKGMTYLRVTPKTEINRYGFSAIVSQDPRAIYRQAFLDHSTGVESRAHIEDAAVLPILRTALDRLGVDERGFIANRTQALEAWSLMEGRPNREAAGQQFNSSLFARQYGVQWVGEDGEPEFKTNRSEVRAAANSTDLHKKINKELRKVDEVLHALPHGDIPEFSRIQVLLAALYGGDVQLHAEQTTVSKKTKGSRPHWEKRTYEFRWGLYALADKYHFNQLSADQKKKIKGATELTVQQLAELGIRAEQKISSSVIGGEISIGDILTHEPAFQNPFLHTFLGASKKTKFASTADSRLNRAIEILTSHPAVKGHRMTQDEKKYLRHFDNIFIPYFKMDKEEPFIIRVQHNNVRGPYKGGIRLVDAFTLLSDKHYMRLFNDLKDQLNLTETRYFQRRYIVDETLPLAVGMTGKAAVVDLPYGGGKGTMLVADVVENALGEKLIVDLHHGHDATAYLFQLARNTARVFAEAAVVRSDTDIPAADLNSGRYMDAMADEQIETTYEILRPKLEEIVGRRGDHWPPEDIDFINQYSNVPKYTAESLEQPMYLKILTEYGNQLRKMNRKIPVWAEPFFEAASTYTSKSEKYMGSIFRNDSTGHGGIYVLGQAIGKPLAGMTVKLMGLGNVGAPAAEKMLEEGMIIKMISLGPQGAFYKADGGITREEVALVRRMMAEKKDLASLGKVGYEAPGLEYIVPSRVDARLLELDVDVFVLAAVENAIHKDNVAQAHGKFFLELANGAITNEAYDRLVQYPTVMVIPDTMANGGGVTVSYYEWLQNRKNERWTREYVIQRLEKQLRGGVERVAQVRQKYNTDWRTAADILMILEVLEGRRAEKNKSVRSKDKRSEVRVDTDVSTLTSDFGTRRSEVRSVNDQIGGFSYLDTTKNGKVGVFAATEIVRQVTDYLQTAVAKGIFASAVLAKGQDRENPDSVTWQSLVNEEGVVDQERVAAFVREKVQPLAARKAVSFEVHQFLYTLRDDETEMIEKVGGKKTGLLLAIFPENTGGGPDAPGGRGERPWDKPSPYGPQGGQALVAESAGEFEPSTLFGREHETADSQELVTIKKDKGRSEVRSAVSKLEPEELTAARTEEFFAIRDELLAIFSRYKKAKSGPGQEAEQTRLLAQARRFSKVLPSFIGEIRSRDAAEQTVLGSYASMNSKTRQGEALKLGQDIRALTPRFVEQWQIYNRKGVSDADKKVANTALNRLNAEIVKLAKRRLKVQLLQFKTALEADPLHQGTIFALLMSITDLYQRIRYEYQWRTFRSEGSIRTARLPMIGALGLVRDNLPYQSEPVLRVGSEEKGGVTISQIVWKYKPVEGSEPALIPEMTSMLFADFPTALRAKEHALESQEQDYAALTDHDFILRGVKDTLDWYVKSREPLPEETRDQLIVTLMSVQAGPNGRFGLKRRIARHYEEGARQIRANVLEKPGFKIDLAITNIQTGTVEKLKEAAGAIEAAQLWTRARREYIERITVSATHRKRDYAYALMRDALIRDALNAIKTDLTAAVVSGSKPVMDKARTAEQNLRGLEQTYFRFIAQSGFAEPEIILYKNLQRELRGIVSTLAGLISDLSRPTLPRSAAPTAEALDRKINGVLATLTSAAERRKISLSRAEVRADADASALQAAVKLDVSRQLAGTNAFGRSEVRAAPIARFNDEQRHMIEVSAKAYGLKSEFKDYLAEMLWQAWHPDADKKTIKIKIGASSGNFRLTAQMTAEELQTVFGAYNYALAIADQAQYATAAKNAAVQLYSLDGGLGENLGRSEFLEWLIKEGLLKETDVERNPDGTIKIGAKGTDLGYILKIQGKKRYVRIAEAKLMQLVFMAKSGKFAELGITPLVNLQSAESYHKLLKNPYLGDILEKKTKIRTYGEALKDMGIQVVYDQGDQFYIAQNIPAIEMQDGQPVGPAQQAGIGVDIHGGHGMIPFDLFHSPEKWKPSADQKPAVVWFSNGDGLNSSNVDEFVVGKMIVDNLPMVNVLTAATLIDVKGGKNGVKLMTVLAARGVTIEIEVPQMLELSDAKAEGQAKEHQAAGLPEGAQYFGAVSIGKQLFNTNIFVIRMDLVMPILAEIKAALGAEEYFKVIAATRIKKPTKLGKDDKTYMPVDGTIGTSIHNLNEFIMTTRNAKVLGILKRYGFAERAQKKGDSKDRLWGRPFLHFIDSPRTLFFTPTKFPFDMWLQAFSDYYNFDTEKFVFVDARPDLQPPSVELGGAENKWWGELGNYVKIFGRHGKIQDLISLEIYGKVILSKNGKTVRLAKNVRIVNTTGKTVDFHAAKYRPIFKKFIGAQGTLNLDGVTVMITPYGVMTSELSDLYNVPGLSENPAIQVLLDTVKEHLFEGDYARTLAAAQQLAVALHDSHQTIAPEFLQVFSRELEKTRVILSHSWAVQRMDKIIAEAKELKKEFGDGLIHKGSLTEGRQAWLEGQEDLALAYLEGALPVLNDSAKPPLDAHFYAYITHIKDTIRYFRRVAISRAMDQVTLAAAPLQLPAGSRLDQVQGYVAVSHYKEALRVLHRLRDEVVVSQAAGGVSQKDKKKIEAAVDHLSRLITARHLDYSHTAAEARSEVRAGGANELLNRAHVLPENLERAIRQWANRLYVEGKGYPKTFTDAGFEKLKGKGIEVAKYQVERIANIIKAELKQSRVDYHAIAKTITPLLVKVSEDVSINRNTRQNLRTFSEYPITLTWFLHSIYSPQTAEFILQGALKQDAELRDRLRPVALGDDDEFWARGAQRTLRDTDAEIAVKRPWTWTGAKRGLLNVPSTMLKGFVRGLVSVGSWLSQFRKSPLRALAAIFNFGWYILTSGWFWKTVVWTGLPLGFGYGVYRSYFVFINYVSDGHPEDVGELMMAVNNGLFVLALAIPTVLFTAILWNLRTHSWMPGGARTPLGAPPIRRLTAGELKDRGHTDDSAGSARSEVRVKKESVSDAVDAPTVREGLEKIREKLGMSDLGGNELHAFTQSLGQADEAIQGDLENLPTAMHLVAASLKQAADAIRSVHTKTIDALHKTTLQLAKKILAAYPEKPGEANRPGPKTKRRSEVRYDTTVSTRARIRAAELLDGLFLTDDLNEWERNGNMPASAARYLEVPRVRSDLDSVLTQAADLFSTSKPATGEWMDRFPGETLREQERNTYIIGPELVRRYGPVLIALEQSAPEAARLIVLARNDTEARDLEQLVRPINNRLPKNRRLMIKTPQQSRVLLKADTLRGLGLGEVDATLLRQIIPDFLPLNVFELDAWVSQVPGLTALVQKFRALSVLASAA